MDTGLGGMNCIGPPVGRDERWSTCASGLVDALETFDELLGERFAGFSPEKAAADAAVFFYQKRKGKEHFDILLDMFRCGFIELFVFEVFGEPWGVEAEVDADVAVLVEAGVVELWPEAEDANGRGLLTPERIESCGTGFGLEITDWGGVLDVWSPELPTHLELVGGVFVELLGGFGYGVLDDGGFGVAAFFGTVVVDVDALVGWRFGEAERIGGGGYDALGFGRGAGRCADGGELAHNRNQSGGQ